jgi:hypothetical protein
MQGSETQSLKISGPCVLNSEPPLRTWHPAMFFLPIGSSPLLFVSQKSEEREDCHA